MSLIGKKYIDEVNDPVINISVNASICTIVLYCLAGVSSGIYVGRLPIFMTLWPCVKYKKFKIASALV